MRADELWQPFQPTESQPWSVELAAHLYRRAGFAANWSQLEEAVHRGPAKTVESLFAEEDRSFASVMTTLKRQIRAAGSVEGLPNYWLYRMARTPVQLLEKMTLFWHGHFATSAAKVDEATLMLDQNDLLRNHALGKFESMVQAISRDPAMLIYLDSRENRKTRPNENYARELMELFCLGLGNYTEDDIKQVARTFTGWEIRNDRFRFNRYQHDSGVKSFLGHTGEFNGDQAVEIVLQQKAAPRFIARKLIQYFITDEPVDDGTVEPLARELSDSSFEIKRAVGMILRSRFFYASVGKKIRSPVELGVGFLRSLEATGNFVRLGNRLRDLGQLPFFPPNVKGWPGGRTWINSATLLGRMNLISELLEDQKTRLHHGSLVKWLKHYGKNTPEEICSFFESLLLAVTIPAESRQAIVDLLADRRKGNQEQRVRAAMIAIASLPEFQLA